MLLKKRKVFILKLLFIFYLLVPVVIWTSYKVFNIYSFGQLVGLMMLALVALQPILSSRMKILEMGVGQDRLLNWHSNNAKTVSILIFVHPSLLFYDYIRQHISLLEISSFYNIYGYLLGYVMLTALLVIVITSLYATKIRLDYELWKKIHLLTYVIILGGFVHSYLIGGHFYSGSPIYYWWGSLFLIALSSILHRYAVLPRKRYLYQIVKIIKETNDVRTLLLEPVNGKIFPYYPGQFAYTRFISKAVLPEEHHFTLSSSPGDPFISFTIKALGDFTSELSGVKVGDRVLVEGPYGTFTNVNSGNSNLLIAGGIGITPLRAMLHHASKQTNQNKTVLLYSAKNKHEFVFYKELKKLGHEKWLKAELYERRLNEKDLKKALSFFASNPDIFLVGPQAMVVDIERKLIALKVPQYRIYTERFALK